MNVVQTLIETSIYAGVLFAALLLAKKLLAGRLSPSLQYVVWFLLLARLLVPVTVQSGFHLFTIPYAEERGSAWEAPLLQDYQVQRIREVLAPQAEPPEAVAPAMAQNTTTPPAQPQAGGQAQPQTPAPSLPKPDTGTILLLVWIGGMAVVGGATLRNYARLQKQIRRTSLLPPRAVADLLCEVKRELGVKRRVAVRMSGTLSTPALTASLFPKILIPIDLLLEPEKLRFALMHELIHFKRLDYIACLLMLVLRAVYWFNPVAWLMQPLIKTDMEASCDSAAAAALDEGGKQRYAATILDMLSGKQKPQLVLGMSLKSNRKTAEKRLRSVFARATTKGGMKAVAISLAVVLGVACFTTACVPQKAEAPEEAELSGGPPVYNEIDGTSFGAAEENVETPAPAEEGENSNADELDPALLAAMESLYAKLENADYSSAMIAATGELVSVSDKYGYTIALMMHEDGLFDSGSAEPIQWGGQTQLKMTGDEISTHLQTVEGIDIYAYTDNVPIQTAEFKDNVDLSSARANNIARYLSETCDIPMELFNAVGKGEFDPIATNDTPEGRAQNRRVEIIVHTKEVGPVGDELEKATLVRFENDGKAAVLERQDGTETEPFYPIGYEQIDYGSFNPKGKEHNIQKAADLLNSTLIEPGQTLSFNEIIGERTMANGWQEAPAIEEGVYTANIGGGVSILSTALYNAALKAELEIAARAPAAIKPAYVKEGLDAAVSTGGPDLAIKNNTDSPIVVMMGNDTENSILTCDIWSPEKRDYTVELDTYLISDPHISPPPAIYVTSESMDSYGVNEIRRGRPYEQYQMVMTKYDLDGNVIEEDIPIGTSTYNAIAGKYELGNGIPLPEAGTPIEEVRALAAQLAGENA